MFGQMVVGPPGSGKSTYCAAMLEFLTGLQRETVVVNLDPANQNTPYECAVDIKELIDLEEVMNELELGPNGALIYCMEYLVENIEWLKEKLEGVKTKYILFDFPGQVELFTQHKACKTLAHFLINKWHYRLCTVHLVDAHHCTDPSKFISVVLVSLSCMLHMETPHINLLSKCDLIEKYAKLRFGLEFYTDVLDLKYLIPHMGDDRDPFVKKHKKLSERIIDVVEGFGLVSFSPLSVKEKPSMKNAMELTDKAIGYVRLPRERSAVLNMINRETTWDKETVQMFQDKYIHQSKIVSDEKNAAATQF
mmetsp:Transcript_20784/g.37012  ORF Transcript_20784/g.37012 Transcript_20784/m.37012 type:complete len:307 (-) Transcript_20784:75-995(-)